LIRRSFDPAFAITAILSIAIGVGANTAIFSVASALLLRPLPYSDAQRLVVLWNRSPGIGVAEDWFSTAQYFDIRNSNTTFEDVAIALGSMVNLTGGYEKGLAEAVTKYDRAYPGRFLTFTEPSYTRLKEPNYPKLQAQAIEQAHTDGARGLKILKTLGLYLRENITSGTLVKIDDPRFDPMWDACGQFNMPVAIHISDPVAFFTPTDRFNERFEELNNHPDWSFYGADFPSNAALIEARNRVMARHPKTQFVTLHFGNFSENLQNVGENLDRYPNMHVDMAARIGELGRQPYTSKKFFDKYQDRILFATDATPHGDEFPQQVFNDQLYEIYYRFLETEDEYFDYAPAKIPPQGRWRIYGINLPDAILRKVYHDNAARLLRV